MAQRTGARALDPRRTAVVVVDVQNDYCHPKGVIAGAHDPSLMERIIQPQVRLLRAAVDAGVFVVFVRAAVLPGHITDSPTRLRARLRSMPSYSIPTLDWVVAGTWGCEVLDELKEAAPGAVEVFKNRNGGFVNTNLDLVLRSNGIDTLVVTGMATDGCVSATVRGAEDHGYRCIVVRDCVSSFKPDLHEKALKLFASRLEVLQAGEVIQMLAKTGATQGSSRAGMAEGSRGS